MIAWQWVLSIQFPYQNSCGFSLRRSILTREYGAYFYYKITAFTFRNKHKQYGLLNTRHPVNLLQVKWRLWPLGTFATGSHPELPCR